MSSRLGVLPGRRAVVSPSGVAEELVGAAAEILHLVHGSTRVDPVDLGQVDPAAVAVGRDMGIEAAARPRDGRGRSPR